MDRKLMGFIDEAINTAREVGIEKRQQSRDAKMQQIERQQQGATRRTQMQTQTQRDIAEMQNTSVGQRDSVKKDTTKDISKSQMAKFRTEALSGAKKQLEGMRDMKGNTINPATKVAMTHAEQQDYVKYMADNIMSYSLGGQEPGASAVPEQQGEGSVTTEGGRRFEIDEGERGGFRETTPAPIERSQIVNPVAPPIQTDSAVQTIQPRSPVTVNRQGSTASRLRAEYDKKRQAEIPSLAGAIGGQVARGARAVGRFTKRITQEPSRSQTVSPLGLRGYMENAYNR